MVVWSEGKIVELSAETWIVGAQNCLQVSNNTTASTKPAYKQNTIKNKVPLLWNTHIIKIHCPSTPLYTCSLYLAWCALWDWLVTLTGLRGHECTLLSAGAPDQQLPTHVSARIQIAGCVTQCHVNQCENDSNNDHGVRMRMRYYNTQYLLQGWLVNTRSNLISLTSW